MRGWVPGVDEPFIVGGLDEEERGCDTGGARVSVCGARSGYCVFKKRRTGRRARAPGAVCVFFFRLAG